MKVYQILSDPASNQIISKNKRFLESLLPLNAERRWDAWTAAFGASGPELHIESPQGVRKGNFFRLHPAVLVHDWQVAEAASESAVLCDDSEYLPAHLKGTGERLCVLNVMGCYNCLDHEHSEVAARADGQSVAITKYAFHSQRILDSPVFKIPETRSNSIYALTGRDDADFLLFIESKSIRD